MSEGVVLKICEAIAEIAGRRYGAEVRITGIRRKTEAEKEDGNTPFIVCSNANLRKEAVS